jgi:hypothetical protein
MTLKLRGVAVSAATVGVVALGALVAPSASAAPSASWAAADDAAIRPGVVTDTEGGGRCTSNFIFSSGGKTFIGQAAHCAGTGTATETNGCDSGSLPLGTAVTIKGLDGTDRKGKLAYSSWITMQKKGESDADTCAYNDFALVEIADGAADVNPTVPVFGGPTGVNTTGLSLGETVYSYQNSPLRLGISALSPKVGIVATEAGGGHSHVVYTVTPGVPGDSGSGFMDDSGKATGVLSTLNIAPVAASNGVADLGKALAYAKANGGIGDVKLVNGTEPFSPNPLGIAGDLLKLPQLP